MSRKKKTVLITLASLLLVIIIVWMFFSPPYEVRYEITDLGTLGGDFYFPFSINNRGHVMGRATTATEFEHAFLWTPEEGMQDIGSFYPFAMNESDEIVGELVTKQIACLWTPDEGLIELGTLGGGVSTGYGINNRSEVVGRSALSTKLCGFIWTATEGMRPFDHGWFPYDINDAGEVLCCTHAYRTELFFFYNRVQDEVVSFDDLTFPLMFPISHPQTRRLSKGGIVYCCLPYREVEGKFLISVQKGYWVSISDSNRVQTVGSIHSESPYLRKVASKRRIPPFLRSALKAVAERFRDKWAVLWEEDEIIDLTNHVPLDSGWSSLDGARGINESGQITGHGTINGKQHTFLLTPI